MGETKENQSDLKELVKEIAEHKILLPDFQREFRWKKEEEQIKLVASVLARMPIGSILLLRSDPKEYGAKTIGHIHNERQIPYPDSDEAEKTAKFLLDGQQRVTVLTNVFSNIIFDSCEKKISELYPALKRRFFLRIPKWTDLKKLHKIQQDEAEEADLFGVYHFKFRYNELNKDPDFLSGDIEPFIVCKIFKAEVKEPFHPFKELSTELETFCLSQEDGYYIPLYLLTDGSDDGNLTWENIRDDIAQNIKNEIELEYVKQENEEKKWLFLQNVFELHSEQKGDWDTKEKVEEQLKKLERLWRKALEDYLKICVKELKLSQIVMDSEQRSRAIDIYENMNRGGVSLNTFDLMMARVATVIQDSFIERMKVQMEKKREYPLSVLPDKIQNAFKEKEEYNATIATGCFDYKKKEFQAKYIDVFLDVLSLYCRNPSLKPDEFKLEYIKKDKILDLDPKQIRDSYSLLCEAIDRALFFFQTRCGIRYLKEMNYSLMLVLVSVLFTNKAFFEEKHVHNILEAWYWGSVFSGEFDKDQNNRMITHLKKLAATLQGEESTDWIKNIAVNIFNIPNFSGKELLLMDLAQDGRVPKKILQSFICQYWLAQTYPDMFEPTKVISVFCEDADELEAHHIIPLGSAKKMSESAKELRNNSKHICNSPLNFVYITKRANKGIMSDSLDSYAKKITSGARASLHIDYNHEKMENNIVKIREELEERCEKLKGDIESKLNILLL